MPKVHLRPAFVAKPPLPKDKAKVDYFDSQLSGFLLEVRCTGTSTYYLCTEKGVKSALGSHVFFFVGMHLFPAYRSKPLKQQDF